MLDNIELSVFEDYSFDNKKEYKLVYHIDSQPPNFIYI